MTDGNDKARIYLANEIRENMPNLTDEERAAAVAIFEAGAASMGISLSDYIRDTFPGGIFGDIRDAGVAALYQGNGINGAVSTRYFGDGVRAVIYASKTADFSTWCHELSHVWQAQLTGKLKNDAEKAFQVKDGDWQNSVYTFADGTQDTSAEAFAYGFEDFLKHKAVEKATDDKKAVFEKFADYMSRTYNGMAENIRISDDIALVYNAFVQLDDNVLANAEKAVRIEKQMKNASQYSFAQQEIEKKGIIQNNPLQFQLVGERSILRMAESEEKERMLSDLSAAKLMDEKYKNMDPASKVLRIRFATGWEKSADGRWKYETDDSMSRIKSGSLIEKMLNTSPDMLAELSERTPLVLADVLDAPEIFEIFPFMRNVSIHFYSDKNPFRAVITPEGIKLNTCYLKKEDGEKGLKGVLAHEIQHVIQAVEYSGSKGLQGNDIKTLYDDIKGAMKALDGNHYDYDTSSLRDGLDTYMRDIGEVEARNVARRITMSYSERRHNTLESTEDIPHNIMFQRSDRNKKADNVLTDDNDRRKNMSDTNDTQIRNDEDIKKLLASKLTAAADKINLNADNWKAVNEILRMFEDIADGKVNNSDLDRPAGLNDGIAPSLEEHGHGGIEEAFRSFSSGESLFALSNYEQFYDNLLDGGIVDADDEVLLVTRSEAESLGLKLRKNAQNVVMVHDPDENHEYSWEENYYHISDIENQDRVLELCLEKGYRYKPVPAKDTVQEHVHENPVSMRTRSFFSGSSIGSFDGGEYNSFVKNLTRRNFIGNEDQIYLLSEKDAEKLDLRINEDAEFLLSKDNPPVKYYHVSDVKNQDRVERLCRDNGYKYNPLPEPLPDLKLDKIAMIVNGKLQEYDHLMLYSMDGTSYTFGDANSFLNDSSKPGRFVTMEKDKFEKIRQASLKAEIRPMRGVDEQVFITTQYDDFFKCRANNHLNFRHNLEVLSRKEANSPIDAIKIAQNLINTMTPAEQAETKRTLSLYKRRDQTFNQLIVDFYHEGVEKVPLNKDYVLKYRSDKLIKPYNDVISHPGKKIEADRSLVYTVDGERRDMNLEVGQTLHGIKFDTQKLFGKGKESMSLDNLQVISASKESNSVTLMDPEKNTYIEVRRDMLLEQYKTQVENEMKRSRSQTQSVGNERQDIERNRSRRHDIDLTRS